jgi:phosphatidylglycerophosphatase A
MTDSGTESRPIFALAIATVCGIGYVPFAPGSFGSAAGLLLLPLVQASPAQSAAMIVFLFAIGSWSGGVAERHFRKTDPGPVVVDEVLGMVVTMFMNPSTWTARVAGFFLFRLFDIVKPYPANRLERVPGGAGVMADDFMAAVYANLALRVLLAVGHRITG